MENTFYPRTPGGGRTRSSRFKTFSGCKKLNFKMKSHVHSVFNALTKVSHLKMFNKETSGTVIDCSSSNWETEAERCQAGGQPVMYSDTLLRKEKRKK